MSFDTIDTNTMKISKIYDENELSKIVFDTIEYYKKDAEHWRKLYTQIYSNTEDKIRKDFEDIIAYYKSRFDMSYGEFSSQKEKDAYNDFEQCHMHDRLTSKANGGRAPYLIPTGVGIGTQLTVVCPICGEKEDITDIGVW